MSIIVDVTELRELGDSFGKADEIIEDGVKQGLTIAGIEMVKEARGMVPVDTGALRMSIESNLLSTDKVEIGPTQPYGRDIEQGRKPPVDVSASQLMGWAKRKGLNPYAVAASIRKKGTAAQPYLFPAADSQEDNVAKILGQAIMNAFNRVFGSSK